MAETKDNDQAKTTEALSEQIEIPVLPLQNTTLFPETVVPLAVGRERSTRAVEAALATEEKLLACITTKTENVTGDDAKTDDLYKIGTHRQHQADDAERGHHAVDRSGHGPL